MYVSHKCFRTSKITISFHKENVSQVMCPCLSIAHDEVEQKKPPD